MRTDVDSRSTSVTCVPCEGTMHAIDVIRLMREMFGLEVRGRYACSRHDKRDAGDVRARGRRALRMQ